MLEHITDHTYSSPKGALEIGLRARERAKELAVITAEARKDYPHSARRSENPWKSLVTSLFSFL